MSERSRSDLALYGRALREARPYWALIGLYFLLGLLATPLSLLVPVPIKIVTDSVLGSEPPIAALQGLSADALLALAAALFVSIALLKELQSRTTSLTKTYASEKLVLGFRARIVRHVQRLSVSYHDTMSTADATYRIMWDANSVSTIAIEGLIPTVIASITALSMLIVILAVDLQLGLLAVAITPALLLSTRSYRRQLRPRYRHVKQLESSALAVVQEVLTSLRVVKAFGQEEREQARYMGRASEGVRARLRIALSEGMYGILNKGILAVGTASVLYLGARHVQEEIITLGDLLLILAYVGMLYDPITTITSKLTSMQSSLVSAERAFTLLDESPDVPEASGAIPVTRAVGQISFEGVSYQYRNGP